jgi:hypothetical protein
MGYVKHAQTHIPHSMSDLQVDFNGPKPCQGLIPLTLGIWVTDSSVYFELLTKQQFVFLKLGLPRLKLHHLPSGFIIYTGLEGHCLLH